MIARRWMLLAMVVAVPVGFVKGFFTDPFNVPKLALLVAGTGVVGALKIEALITRRERFVVRDAWLPAAFICVPLLVSWAASPYRAWALFGQYPRFQGLVPYLVFALFGLLLVDALSGRRRELAYALVAGGALAGGYALLQSLGLDPLTWIVEGAPYPVTHSTGGHPNYTGGFLAMALPMTLYLWSRTGRVRLLGAAATILVAAGLIVSLSQGPWAAAAGAVAVLAGAAMRRRRSYAPSAALTATAFIGIAMIAPVVISMTDAAGFGGPFGGTSRTRGAFWKASLSLAVEHPVIGNGPNSFAVDAVRHRSLEEAIRSEYDFTDDPHSVPLSFLANAGIVGFAGYIGAAIWIVLRARRVIRKDLLGSAFAAAAVAYLLQGLVGVDEPIQRTGAWVAIAGLALSSPLVAAPLAGGPSSRMRRGVAMFVAATIAFGTTAWAVGFLRADRDMVRSLIAFENGDIAAARSRFEQALSFRDEYLFRHHYAENLGVAALDRGAGSTALVAEMLRVNRHLRDFPEHTAIAREAEVLHYWGHHDMRGDLQALDRYDRLRRIDPENPLVETQMSEVLLDLGRTRAALTLLEPLTDSLAGRAPDFWAILAIARLQSGDIAGARLALETARAVTPATRCRVEIASLLIVGDDDGGQLTLPFICDLGLLDWFQDRSMSTGTVS